MDSWGSSVPQWSCLGMMGRQPPSWEDLFISCHGNGEVMTQPHPLFPHPHHHLGVLNPFLISQTAPQDFILSSRPSSPKENTAWGPPPLSLASLWTLASHPPENSCLNRKGMRLACTSMEACMCLQHRQGLQSAPLLQRGTGGTGPPSWAGIPKAQPPQVHPLFLLQKRREAGEKPGLPGTSTPRPFNVLRPPPCVFQVTLALS